MGGEGRQMQFQGRKSKEQRAVASHRNTTGCSVTWDPLERMYGPQNYLLEGKKEGQTILCIFWVTCFSKKTLGKPVPAQIQLGGTRFLKLLLQPSPHPRKLPHPIPMVIKHWFCYHLLTSLARKQTRLPSPGDSEDKQIRSGRNLQKLFRAIISSNQGPTCMCDI